jgi:hypothetical protein
MYEKDFSEVPPGKKWKEQSVRLGGIDNDIVADDASNQSSEDNVLQDWAIQKIIKDSHMMGKNYIKGKKLKLDMNLRSHMKFLELLRTKPENNRRLPTIEQISIKNVRRGIKDDVKSFLEYSFPQKVDKFSFNTGTLAADHVSIEDYIEAKGDEIYGPLFKCFQRTRNEVVICGCEFDTSALGKIFKSCCRNKKLGIVTCKITKQDDDEDDEGDIYINDDDVEYNLKQIDFTGTGDEANSNWAEDSTILEKLIEVMGDEKTLIESLKKVEFKDCGVSDELVVTLLNDNDLGHVTLVDSMFTIDEEEEKGENSDSRKNNLGADSSQMTISKSIGGSDHDTNSQSERGNGVMDTSIFKDICNDSKLDADMSLTSELRLSLEKNFSFFQVSFIKQNISNYKLGATRSQRKADGKVAKPKWYQTYRNQRS